MPITCITLIINGKKVRMVDGVLSGPQELVDKIVKANDELRDSWATCREGHLLDIPPGNLAQLGALIPLAIYVFGEKNVKIDRSEPYLTGTENDPPGTIY